jgi:hypothetical protein
MPKTMTETSKRPSASRESPVLGGDSQRLLKSPSESPGEMGEALSPPTRVSRAGCARYRAGCSYTH